MSADRPPGRPGRRFATVRFRVTALAAVVVLLVLTGASAGLVLVHGRVLTRNLDGTLRQRSADLAGLAVAERLPSRPSASDDDSAVQVVTLAGQVVAASSNLAGQPEPLAPSPLADGPDEVLRTVRDVPLDDGSFRVVSRRADTPSGTLVVHVASSLDDVMESTGTLRTSLVVAVPAVAALLALLVWWLVGRTLGPVEAIRAQVAGIGGTELHRRVPEPAGDDEIARLARTMNAMLGRVEDAAGRQRRFVADASHELRSPLTRIRSEVEVDLAHPAGADPAATHRSVLDETIALQRLVEGLLVLARSDEVRGRAASRLVDLDDIVLQHAGRIRSGAQVAVDTRDVSAAQVQGDGAELERAVANLVDNAVRHAANRVTLTLSERDGAAILRVADDGSGVPEHERERVFERFARLDDARSTAAGGAGLGLAIARDIARRHSGDITIDASHAPGACFVLALPVADGGRRAGP
ncbi:MAG: HAMP domain-containing sensor histidine kinase [Acidimicrobiales bacterium]